MLTVLANGCYRWLAKQLHGFETAAPALVPFNADFHGGKSINIFRSHAPHGYWKTSGRFCNQGIF
jgi:hypothetical protein